MAEAQPMTQEMLDRWVGLRMAHEAMMVEDAQALLRQNREQVAAHYRANGVETAPEEPSVIHVGNITNNHPAPPTPPPLVQPPAKGLSTLAKAGIAAAMLGSGAAVPLAVNALWPDDSKPAAEQAFDPSKWEIIIPGSK